MEGHPCLMAMRATAIDTRADGGEALPRDGTGMICGGAARHDKGCEDPKQQDLGEAMGTITPLSVREWLGPHTLLLLLRTRWPQPLAGAGNRHNRRSRKTLRAASSTRWRVWWWTLSRVADLHCAGPENQKNTNMGRQLRRSARAQLQQKTCCHFGDFD